MTLTAVSIDRRSSRDHHHKNDDVEEEVEEFEILNERNNNNNNNNSKESVCCSISDSSSLCSPSPPDMTMSETSTEAFQPMSDRSLTTTTTTEVVVQSPQQQQLLQQKPSSKSSLMTSDSTNEEEEPVVTSPVKPNSKTSLSSSGGTSTANNNSSNDNDEEDSMSMGLSPISSSNRAIATAGGGGGQLWNSATSNLSVSATNHNNTNTNINLMHESWQTGATRKKKNTGRGGGASAKKWKDPFALSPTKLSPRSPAAAAGGGGGKKKNNRNPPIPRTISGGPELLSSQHSSNDNNENVSKRTQFRRTASVPADIASLTSGQSQFPASSIDNKKIQLKELLGLESSVLHTKKASAGGGSGSGYGKGGGSSGVSVSSSKSENITSTTNNNTIAAPLATKNNDGGDGDADENHQQEGSISRRRQFRRSTSVPIRIGVADLPAVSSRPTTPTPQVYMAGEDADNMAVKDYLTEFLHNGETEAPLLMNQHNDAVAVFNDHHDNDEDGGDDTDGDSTIEESWHQLSDKRKILAEAMEISSGVPPDMPHISSSTATVKSSSSAAGTTATAKTVGGGIVNNKSSLDNFLDALIFDAKKSTSEKPEEQSLSRRSHSERRRKSSGGGGGGPHHHSVRSVGGALDNNPTIYIQGGPMTSQQQHQGYDAASSPDNCGRTAGVLWARKGQKPRSERIPSKASLMSTASSISSTGGHGSVLSAFLERESKHGRPSAAHSVAGDRVASSGAISIVLSEDGQSKTFTVGAREAKLVEKLLQATNEVQSPEKKITSTTSMKGWLEQVAGNLKSPSGHSEIQNSARVSTRSSLAVELSPPLADGSLKSYLDLKRGRRGGRGGGAFTVAGDRVSTRFKGKSTQEMLKMLDTDRARKRLPGAPPLASTGGRTNGGEFALPVRPASAEPRRHKSHTGEAHPRNHHPYVETGELANMKYSGGLPLADLHNSMPVISYDPDGQNDDDIEGSDRVFPRSFEVPLSSEDADDRIDERIAEEKKYRRRARSTTPTKGRVMHDGMTENPRRATSNPKPRGGGYHSQQRPRTPTGGKQKERLGDSLNNKDVDLKDFRPPASTRPMNRRSLMRKMHSVPVMSDTNFHLDDDDDDDDDDQATPAASGGKTAKKSKKKSKKKRSKSDASSISRKSRSKRNGKDALSSSMHASPVSAALKEEGECEMDFAELGNKSFLDRLLDGEVDAHDSASQIHGPDSPVKAPLQAKEEYKAGLMDAPIEESTSKLRIEPDYLDGTNRMILQDPGKAGQSRRDLMSQKKQRSSSNLMNTSSALKDLYDSPKVDAAPAATSGDDEDENVEKLPLPEGGGIAAAKSPLKSPLQKIDHKRKGSKTKSKSVSEGTKKKKKSKAVSESTKMKSPTGKTKSKSKSMSAASPDDALKSGSKHGKKSKSATEYELKLPSTHARKGDDSKDGAGDDDENNVNSPSMHSMKSPSKKKKTPKGKKGKVSKEGKKGKRSRSSSARRRVSTDDEDEKKGFGEKNAVFPGAGLRRSSSCSRLDVDILSVEDNLLHERIHSLTRDHSPPPTPNSEKAVMGDKPLRKGRKPKNPNQVSMTGEPGERKGFKMETARWKSPLRDRDGSPRRDRDGSPRRDRDGSPRRSPRREREENVAPGSPRLPTIPPFGQSTERSEDENILQSEFGGSPAPVRKPNVQLNSQGLKSALKTDVIASPQQSPRRYTRPIPVTGRENTVLEVYDDDSVVSDITDHYFDVTEEDVARYKMKSTPNLSRIDEPNGEEDDAAHPNGSWAGLSHSFKSRDGNDAGTVESQDHKARRWHSMRDLGSAHSGGMSAPRTPLRGSKDTDILTEKDGTKTPTRLGWLKKRLGLAKKK